MSILGGTGTAQPLQQLEIIPTLALNCLRRICPHFILPLYSVDNEQFFLLTVDVIGSLANAERRHYRCEARWVPLRSELFIEIFDLNFQQIQFSIRLDWQDVLAAEEILFRFLTMLRQISME